MAYDPSNEAEEASNLLALARQTHEAHVAAAKRKADEIVSRAETEASTILENSRAEFEFLQAQITKHREFELRYRGALKNYLSDLLDEINVEDEFIVEAPEAPVAVSAFSEVDEDEAIEAAANAAYEAAQAPVEEVVPEPEYAPVEVAPEPEYYAPAEPVYEPVEVVEPVYEEPVYEAPAATVEEPVYYDNFENDEYEEAPTPSYPAAYVPDEPVYAAPTEYVSDDLPAVPETIDSYGTDAEEVLIFDKEVAVGDAENDYELAPAPAETAAFDQLFTPPQNDLADSIASIVEAEDEAAAEEDSFFAPKSAAAAVDETDPEVDKKLKGFFGFKR